MISSALYSRVEVVGDCTIYLGDSTKIAPEVEADCVVTDPPYGVGLTYTDFTDDTPELVSQVAVPLINMCSERFKRTVLTPGVKNMFLYRKPSHVGSIYYPAGAGMNSWGFTCWQPLFFYGKDPYGGKGSRPDSFASVEAAEKNGHPCPKPIGQMRKIVDRCTLPGEVIYDPFMGSGTTGVACMKLGRKFIGSEIDPGYFEISLKRLKEAHAQPDMFIQDEPKFVQESMI